MAETLPVTRWNVGKVVITSTLLLLFSLLPGLRNILRWWLHRFHRRLTASSSSHISSSSSSKKDDTPTAIPAPLTVAFFHPYCNAGGGGERVLWVAIKAIQEKYPDVRCVVYTGDYDSSGPAIMAKALSSFQIHLPRPPEFVFLRQRVWVEASTWPAFTLLGQSLGSVYLAWEALTLFVPDVLVDSMGYAFTLPLFANLAQSKVASYVHYPTISTDMLDRVRKRERAFNHSLLVAESVALTKGKLFYYHVFARLYRLVGSLSLKVMVNSTWTKGHIDQLWKCDSAIVYPPCNTTEFQKLPLEREENTENRRYGSHQKIETILSIGQFRPEKDHALQIASFAGLVKRLPEERKKLVKLILAGGCRNAEDFKRVEHLQTLCEVFQVSEQVEFRLNISFDELTNHLATAIVGLHTMYNEHFGIGVVELMAGGVIVIANASGGPKMDIVVPTEDGGQTGFLASDEDDYAAAMARVLAMPFAERMRIRENARGAVRSRFSDEAFCKEFMKEIDALLA